MHSIRRLLYPDAFLDLQIKCLTSEDSTHANVLDGLQSRPFVYAVYHVALRTGKPCDAALLPHNTDPLNLLDIVRSRHPAGEVAFLLCSHTAKLMGGSIPEEVLHFSAAFNIANFEVLLRHCGKRTMKMGRTL